MKKLLVLLLLFNCGIVFARGNDQFYNGDAPSSVTIGSTSTSVLTNPAQYKIIRFINDSDETIYLSDDGSAAVMNKGVRLNSNGGSWTLTYPDIPRKDIYGICSSGSKVLCVSTGD